ncbi:MAG: hypothetical protein ACP5UF_06940 [Hydrogenobaculum sp.]
MHFFVFEDLLVLLLFGTSKEGAIHIVNELKEFFWTKYVLCYSHVPGRW